MVNLALGWRGSIDVQTDRVYRMTHGLARAQPNTFATRPICWPSPITYRVEALDATQRARPDTTRFFIFYKNIYIMFEYRVYS